MANELVVIPGKGVKDTSSLGKKIQQGYNKTKQLGHKAVSHVSRNKAAYIAGLAGAGLAGGGAYLLGRAGKKSTPANQ